MSLKNPLNKDLQIFPTFLYYFSVLVSFVLKKKILLLLDQGVAINTAFSFFHCTLTIYFRSFTKVK